MNTKKLVMDFAIITVICIGVFGISNMVNATIPTQSIETESPVKNDDEQKLLSAGDIMLNNNVNVALQLYEQAFISYGSPESLEKLNNLYNKYIAEHKTFPKGTNHIKAMRKLSSCYMLGIGVTQDDEKAFDLYRRSTKLDEGALMTSFALFYDIGLEGVAQDKKKALKWYEKAAKKNSVYAMCYLNKCYMSGIPEIDVQQNISQATRWLRKAKHLNPIETELFSEQSEICLETVKQINIKLYQITLELKNNIEECLHFYHEKRAYKSTIVCSDSQKTGMKRGRDDKSVTTEHNPLKRNNSDMATHTLSSAEMALADARHCDIIPDKQKEFEQYKDAASKGNAEAMHVLGEFYEFGVGVSKDLVQALEWYNKAASTWKKLANEGNAKAMYCLGRCYERGEGVERNKEKTIEMYLKAAKLGNAEAIYKLREYYPFVRKEVKEANEKYLKTAVSVWEKESKTGNVEAMRNLGKYYDLIGKEIQNQTQSDELLKKALELLKNAAKKNDVDSIYYLGECCWNKSNGSRELEYLALEYFVKAVNLGSTEAMAFLGQNFVFSTSTIEQKSKLFKQILEKHDVSKAANIQKAAFDWLEEAAQKGNSAAMNRLGNCYEWGIKDLLATDPKKAFEYYSNAARKGSELAVLNLGRCFEKGIGVTANMERAFRLYIRAIENGNSAVMFHLGNWYIDGNEEDKKKAFSLYRDAAELGNVYAIHNLAYCYENGVGIQKNEDEAKKLLSLIQNRCPEFKKLSQQKNLLYLAI